MGARREPGERSEGTIEVEIVEHEGYVEAITRFCKGPSGGGGRDEGRRMGLMIRGGVDPPTRMSRVETPRPPDS